MLTTALCLATHLHREDCRVNEPYVNHVLRVAIRISCHFDVQDAEVVAAGLLHDTVEDHARELAGTRNTGPGYPDDETIVRAVTTIRSQFGPRVAQLVAAVTNPKYASDRDPDEQYREHLATSLERNPWARVIKVSDFTDNGVGVIHLGGPKAIRVAHKYRPMVPVLRELVSRPDTPLSPLVKRHIFDQLDLAEGRFNEILDPTEREPIPYDG